MVQFMGNGAIYETDGETLDCLNGILPSARERNDWSAVQALMICGLLSGRIKRVDGPADPAFTGLPNA